MNISECRVCGSERLVDCIDLGEQPWCNDFQVSDKKDIAKRYPLVCCFCEVCTTLQVRYTVPKEIMYADHTYLSGSNKFMHEHFLKIAERALGRHRKSDSFFVADVGSNDGTLLKQYQKLGCKVLGVEPNSTISKIANDAGVPTRANFFNLDEARAIVSEYGKADIVSAANVFYHVEDLHSVVGGVSQLLDENGLFVIQASYLPTLIDEKAFDIMYHEHLLYYRLENLQTLLTQHGLQINDFQFEDVHGGSVIVYASRTGAYPVSDSVADQIAQERSRGFHKITKYHEFQNSILKLKEDLRALIGKLKESGSQIAAYGAPAKGTVMLNFCGLDDSSIDFAAEINELKVDRYIPGTGIQIRREQECPEPDYYLLLSWNFKDFFVDEAKRRGVQRRFIIPVPRPHILNDI